MAPFGLDGAPALGPPGHARKRHAPHVLLAALATVWSVLLLSWSADPVAKAVVELIDDVESRRISAANWPMRDWRERPPLLATVSTIDRPDELLYFHQVLPLLQASADNRLNMHRVLTTRRRAEEYPVLHAVYHHRQREVLRGLAALVVPPRLAEVHRRVLAATEGQIDFFGVFVDAKTADPAIDLRRKLSPSALQSANRELHEAWDLISRTSPALDRAARDAIESGFRRLDAT